VGKIVLGSRRDPRGHADSVFSNDPRPGGHVSLWREGGCTKYPWLSIHIHDPMMKGKILNLQGMESIEKSIDPRAKEKHEEEHEDSKRERKSRTTSYYNKNHKTTRLV
jgi:hypothetical protein